MFGEVVLEQPQGPAGSKNILSDLREGSFQVENIFLTNSYVAWPIFLASVGAGVTVYLINRKKR